jgi:tetratricopeptide (TPR) repeat protein
MSIDKIMLCGHLSLSNDFFRLQLAAQPYLKSRGPQNWERSGKTTVASVYNKVATNLDAQGKYAEARPLLQKALAIYRKSLGEEHPDTAASYLNLADNQWSQGRYAAALAFLETSARSYEATRLGVSTAGLERATFGAARSPYPALAAARSGVGRWADAWTALEADLARGLLDEMALRRGIGLTPTERRQRDELRTRRVPLEARILALVSLPLPSAAEGTELKGLLDQRQKLDKSLGDLAVAVSRREVATLGQWMRW